MGCSPIADSQAISRVKSEFLEMPGLRVTVDQAARLWGIDVPTIERLLEELVAGSFLRRSGSFYLLADSGRLSV